MNRSCSRCGRMVQRIGSQFWFLKNYCDQLFDSSPCRRLVRILLHGEDWLEFFSVPKIHFLQKNTIPGEKAAVLRSEIPEKKPSVSSAEKRRKTAIFQGFFDKNAVFRRKFENFFESGKTGGGVFENASLILPMQRCKSKNFSM